MNNKYSDYLQTHPSENEPSLKAITIDQEMSACKIYDENILVENGFLCNIDIDFHFGTDK
jgi:hypothetical protein